jgi:aldehyde:ferredoxin oxidoreductase
LFRPIGREDDVRCWTGKRLIVDLSLFRAWTEEIPVEDREAYWGGRGLNGRYFLDHLVAGVTPDSPENLIVFAVGPLAGTPAPCSGWTSVSTLSPVSSPPRYAHLSLPGHWGPQLKFAGFDQLIVRGKAERPICLLIEGEKVSFKDAKHLRGKDTVETTVTLQEEKEDRDLEVLCIGPAGENLVSFANVTGRFSWTGDHIGLGYVFGSKNLKAIAIQGNIPVSLHDSDRFLQSCLSLIHKIQKDQNGIRLKDEGTFMALRHGEGGFGIRNFNASSQSAMEEKWRSDYFANYFYGREGCFSCPIHCGRISEVNGTYFGGVHFESAWSLGPRIGIEKWEKTLRLHRSCQLQGLDPSSIGTLLSWIMDCYEKGILSDKELGPIPISWGEEKGALQLIESIVARKGIGEILSQGGLRAAFSLGKGAERVSHFWGMDLPVRDPRSSGEYALGRALFPFEWDYLQTLPHFSPVSPGEKQPGAILRRVLALEEQKVLSDLNSLCPLVVTRIPLVSCSEIAELLRLATGVELDENTLMESIHKTLQIERILWQRLRPETIEWDPFPLRFFEDPSEKRRLQQALADFDTTSQDGG